MSEKLVCDDCGSLNTRDRQSCELCQGSLREERERDARGSLAKLTFAAVGLTLLMCVVPGVVLYHLLWLNSAEFLNHGGQFISPLTFAIIYAVAWGILALIRTRYMPKDDYDLGHGTGPYRVDKIFTLRDDYDRAHLGVGLALFPVNVVVGSWLAVLHALRRDS